VAHDATSPADAPTTSTLTAPRTTWSRAPWHAARGGLIGAAESVPGISGGTVALVVGLYDELIAAAAHVVHAGRAFVVGVVRRRGTAEAGAALRRVDWRLVLPVLAGMAVVLVLSLRTLAPLLESHPVPTRAVFAGMIAASLAVPLGMMPARPRVRDAASALVAAVAAFLLTGIPPVAIEEPSLWYVVLGAAIAINALVVPGLSGSALLVVLGLYVPVQAALDGRDAAFVGAFVLGAALGFAAFVRTLQWLLHERRQVTMAVVTGLMIGSLRALWPWQDDDRGLLAPQGDVGQVVALVVAGAVVVGGLVAWERRRAARARAAAEPAAPAVG
jgi:putative membrane protein